MPWLITWEATNADLLPEKRIAGVVPGNVGPERVRRLVEALYATHVFTEAEIVRFGTRPAENPYPAEFGQLQGKDWLGEITCGHNPHLRARLVDGLREATGEDGKPTLKWRERPRPDVQSRSQ